MASRQAEQSKVAGNAAFKALDYPLALAHYSTAIARDPSVATYPLNRALVHLKLSQFKDAQRDADTALSLDGGVNPKALFRRALAYKGLGDWHNAERDLTRAIEQGAGTDVETELAHVRKQLEANASQSTQAASSTPNGSAASSRTDRLRAAISPSSPDASSPADSRADAAGANPTSKAHEPPVDRGFGMKAVSTRRLKPTDAPTVAESPSTRTPPVAPSKTPGAPPPSISSRDSPLSSFAAKKLSRQTRQTSSAPSVGSTGPSNPSIPSTAKPPSPIADPSTAKSLLPLRNSTTTTDGRRPPPPPPTTLTSLESHLVLAPPDSSSRIELLKSLDPTIRRRRLPRGSRDDESEPDFVEFVGDSLTPDLLSLILSEFDRHLLSLDENPKRQQRRRNDEKDEDEDEEDETGWMVELLKGLSKCRRFETSRMLLSEQETDVVKRVVERERKRLEEVEKEWGV